MFILKKSLTAALVISQFICIGVDTHALPPTSRIIDGTAVSESQFPYVARLTVDNELLCTGTLVSPNHILTAAHCFYDENNRREIGNRDVVARLNGQYFGSSRVYIHPNYKSRSSACVEGENDAAIIELSSAVSGITPINLIDGILPVGSSLLLAGYGTQGNGDIGENGTIPNEGTINIGSTSIEGYGDDPPSQNNNSLYAYWRFDRGEANTASGDSGGPAFVQSGDNLLLASITCGGGGNAEIGTLSFNTRADLIHSWVKSITGIAAGDSAPGFIDLRTKSVSLGEDFSYLVPVTGSQPFELSASNLPPGLALNGSTISGIATTAGAYNVTLIATNVFGSARTTLTIVVSGYLPVLKVKKVLLQFDHNAAAHDFLNISGTLIVGKKFNPDNKKVTIKIGKFAKSFKLDSSGKSIGNKLNFFNLNGELDSGKYKKSTIKFELNLEKVSFFNELSTLGFPVSDLAQDGEQVSLPLSVTIKGIESSGTSILVFRANDARWRLTK